MSTKEVFASYWTNWYEEHTKKAAEAKKLAESYGATFPSVLPEAGRTCAIYGEQFTHKSSAALEKQPEEKS